MHMHLHLTSSLTFMVLFLQLGSTRNVAVDCPICRKSTELGSGGVEDLPTNFAFKNLAALVSKKSSKVSKKMCNNCEKNVAVAKCIDCDDFLCSDCKDLHGLVKVTRDHTIKELEKMEKPKLKPKPVPAAKPWQCEIHKEDVTCFCFHCSQPVCPFCISKMVLQGSDKHEFVAIEDAVTRLKLIIDGHLESVQEKRGKLEEKVETLGDLMEELTDSMNKTR